MKDIGDHLVRRNVTYPIVLLVSATRRMVVACRVFVVIGDPLVTRNVTIFVLSATRRMVFAQNVIKDIGERAVKKNVAINYQIARTVKWKMERASSVNQDIGVTTVNIIVVLGVQGNVQSRTKFVQYA